MNVPRFWKGCLSLVVFWIIAIVIALIIKNISAQQPSNIYIQYTQYKPNVGVAWLAGSESDVTKIGAYYHYACCSACPSDTAKIPILRPGSFWANCPYDYDGYMLVGNEGEFSGQDDMSPSQMADFIIDSRDSHPDAKFVCLNSYDINYMLDVIELLPVGVCDIYGIHTPVGLQNVSQHLDQLCSNCRIWITEMYALNNVPNAYDIMYNQVQATLADSRVERIFLYTTTEGIHPSLNAVKSDGTLYDNGLGFRDGIQAYP